MSFTRTLYDQCNFKQRMSESRGPSDYQTGTPLIKPSFNENVGYISHVNHRSVEASRIDIESDLNNRTRRASECNTKKFPFNSIRVKNEKKDSNVMLNTEYTREKSACVLAGININRFEPLCANFQEAKSIQSNSIIGMDTRLFEKDSHRQNRQNRAKPLFRKDTLCHVFSEMECKKFKEESYILPHNLKLNQLKSSKKYKKPNYAMGLGE
jgi:hypothetical protein